MKENERSETMLEIYHRCKMNLPFLRKIEKHSTEDVDEDLTSGNVSPKKNYENFQYYEDLPLQNTILDNKCDYYDNNYWNTDIGDFNLEIL